MTSNSSHRAILLVELEQEGQVECRFLAPEQAQDEVCASGTFDEQSQRSCSDYYADLEYLPEGGIPPRRWLSAHREKRRIAAEALIRIGLPGPISERLHRLRSQIDKDMLLLELSTNSPELDRLPWELLGSRQADTQYDSNLVVWRYLRLRRAQAWPQNRMLLVSASPPEQRISPNVDLEFNDIQEQIELSGRRDVLIEEPLFHSSAPQFVAEFFQARPALLHMSLHGDRKWMYFERARPRGQEYSVRSLPAELLPRQRKVAHDSLVAYIADTNAVLTTILSVCYSANRDGDESSFTQKLIEAGVPSAIGMAYGVTPTVSEKFCHVLYREICKGQPIADAYGSAIIALRQLSSYDECLWSVPMLYANDNVIPLPTDDYMRFLDNIKASVKRIEELRRNLARLSAQAGARPGNWSVDSTRTAMGLGKVQNGLRYLRDNAIVTRADSYLWKQEFEAAYRELEHKIAEVRTCLAELGEPRGPAALSRSGQRFRSAAPRLISELDYIRGLVIDEFPAISYDALPA